MRWRKRCLAVAVLACVCGLASVSRAAEGDARGPADPDAAPADGLRVSTPTTDAPRQWYGAQIVLADGIAITELGIAAALDTVTNVQGTSAPAVGGFGTYFLGGPLIHMAHHRSAAVVLGSLGIRAGVPVLTALIGLGVAEIGGHCVSTGGWSCELTVAGYSFELVEATGARSSAEGRMAHAPA